MASSMTEPVRLSKRVAELVGCSRSEAEQYVQGGFVRVDGAVVEEPQFKVSGETVTLDPDARLVADIVVSKLVDHLPLYRQE